jgi:hypothetical protein
MYLQAIILEAIRSRYLPPENDADKKSDVNIFLLDESCQ